MTTSELITPTHLARKALIYVRQSTPQQVLTNQESLRLQYALRRILKGTIGDATSLLVELQSSRSDRGY